MSDVQGKMAKSAAWHQSSVYCFTSDHLRYFLKHLLVDDEGNIAPPLGKWEKRINEEKNCSIHHQRISEIQTEIFTQNPNNNNNSRFADYLLSVYACKMCRSNYSGILFVTAIWTRDEKNAKQIISRRRSDENGCKTSVFHC